MTTERERLVGLEKRLVEAKGPDRELDVALLTTCLGYRDIDGYIFDRGNDGYWSLEGDERNRPLPAPTSSLDAALTLVPEGYLPHLETILRDGVRWYSFLLWKPRDRTGASHAEHKILPIAIGLSSIRTRIALLPQPSDHPPSP